MPPSIAIDTWVWMPHAGHLIVGSQCRFHVTTKVGDYLVSTVGEYWPDAAVREIHADVAGVVLEGRGDARAADFQRKCGYIEIGSDRTYETMVFPAAPREDRCCPWSASDWTDLDFAGYSDAGDAYEGHLAMCEKWAAR